MTVTPERHLLQGRLKRARERVANQTAICPACHRAYDPTGRTSACSTTCYEIARHRAAKGTR